MSKINLGKVRFTYDDFTEEQLAALKGAKGDKGDAFTYEDFTPEQLASLKGDTGEQGLTGADGATFTPSVDAEGNLSWTNDKGLVNPPTVNIKGEKGDSGVNNIDDNNIRAITTYSSNKIETIKEDLDSQIKEIKNNKATKAEVDVERKRIDSFTSLGEGSTTGDAELIDGRIGADGVTYNNIGGAIRGQYTSLDTKKITGVGITKIMTITQEDYDNSPKDPNTLYIISDTTGEEGGGGSHPLIPYLKNTGGNSYIDTGYVPKLNSKFELTARDTSLVTNNRYFGNQMFDMYYAGTSYIGATHGNNYAGTQITNINSKHTYVRNSTEFYVDGQLQATVEAGTKVDNRTLYIFGRHLADGYSTISSEFTFFELKIYENDTLVHHYKPRKDNSNVACLYDIVTQQYLYNSGTGTLEYGTELEEE